jgi:hypothetical protein
VSTDTLALARVPGFESTHYALRDGYIVWTGQTAHSDHPRNLVEPVLAVFDLRQDLVLEETGRQVPQFGHRLVLSRAAAAQA